MITDPMPTDNNSRCTLRARLASFRYAFSGLSVLGKEPNARIHLVIAILTVTAGLIFHISTIEWCAVILCIGIVLALEAVNTAIEALCDHVSPEFAPMIKRAKDVAAAAVLLSAFAAVAVGLIIFLPKVLNK